MRTYGRRAVLDEHGQPSFTDGGVPIKEWVLIEPDANGYEDNIWLATLAQSLLLMINESPFYGDWGIPARDAIIQQMAPDIYIAITQQRFASRFASLIVARQEDPEPIYQINVTTQQGFRITAGIPIAF